MRAAIFSVVAAIVMLFGLYLAARWVEVHPMECDDACKARRARQWDYMEGTQ